jgi:magnesium transporter
MRHRRPPTGSAPGALAPTAGARPARLHAWLYGSRGCRELDVTSVDALVAERALDERLWLDVQGLDDTPTLEAVARTFHIHPLALADAANTPQRPKVDSYDGQLVLVTQMVRATGHGPSTMEQLTLVLGDSFVVSFQELEYGDVLDPVRGRLRAGHDALLASGPDYLAYAMLDTVIDGYFPVLETLGERLERLELEVVESPRTELLVGIQAIKRELLGYRRALWPQRDAVASLVRGDAKAIAESTRVYLRDCYDHTVQLIDVLETYRELATSLTDAYLSSLSNRLNEVMKVLTVISTVFMPLSFLASLYGMNFQHMPELSLPWAYPALLGVMLSVAGGMLVWFRGKGWLGDSPARRRRKRRAPTLPPAAGRR